MIRRLRIAASMFFAIATVALCVLWVRSYWVNEIVSRVSSTGLFSTIGSDVGTVYLFHNWRPIGTSLYRGKGHGWRIESNAPSDLHSQFQWTNNVARFEAKAPYWLVTTLVATFAVLPWVGMRFSLRAMLIATTVIALILGAVVISSR